MRFSVIVVSLNPGERLNMTVDSILSQSFNDYEILIKDGGSTDGSLSEQNNEKIRIVIKNDKSIYDAMNQAVKEAKGEYYIFLNCGDVFENPEVLKDIDSYITRDGDNAADLYYGDMRRKGYKDIIASYPEITDFVCYRNIPCHQVCFYHKRLFEERGYDLAYPVRADYEHFLWCKYRAGASFKYTGVVVCIYEGDGYSETKDNERAAKREHKIITKKYLGKKCIWYKFVMIITLQKLRKLMAQSKLMSGFYQKVKGFIYGKRKA